VRGDSRARRRGMVVLGSIAGRAGGSREERGEVGSGQ
jgi:hypothetical protein